MGRKGDTTLNVVLRKGIPLLEYPVPDYPLVAYAFSTTRHGGCGTGTYASMNCTPYVGDDHSVVERNQHLLKDALPYKPEMMVLPWQTHGVQIRVVDSAYVNATSNERYSMLQGIDALLTDCLGVCLCISTADCVPILLLDVRHHAIAAVHAGWRGTVSGILPAVLRQMQVSYGTSGEDVFAYIGPCISQAAFEVGEEVVEAFRKANFPVGQISVQNNISGKSHIDLVEANRQLLLHFGVPLQHIYACGICSYTCSKDFFSARRLGKWSGRMLTGIMLLGCLDKHEKSDLF